ncbi:MAG: hypothetical protein ACXADU_13635 [Promethearchaeota archaeon]|jgi:uncharacterized protein YdeI (BOF family)
MSDQPAKQRTIEDIKNEDVKIQITGYIEDISEEKNFVLDDTTGKISVITENIKFRSKEKDIVNVIGEVNIKMDGTKSIVAEIIQDMTNLNFDYYLKLYKLKNEYL